MGTNNRERRRAKQKARQEQHRLRQERLREQQRSAFGESAFGETGFGGAASSEAPFGASAFGSQGQHQRARQIAWVDQIVREAATAMAYGETGIFQQCNDLLVQGGGRLGGPRSVDLALLTIVQRNISGLWRRGWQPADVLRQVRRDNGARHARIISDLIAAEMRQYAQNTVDERWEQQLRDLGVSVWWDNDEQLLSAIADREGLGRPELIDHLLKILALFDTCPQIETFCPPPGQARRGSLSPGQPGTGPSSGHRADPRQLDRVRALLAKAESTQYPEEAEAYTAKAQQLMARYSIDYALLAASGGAVDEPTGCRIGVDNPYEAPKVLLLDVVAKANRCRTVWAKPFGYVTVLGFPADLGAVELLFTSLLVQATSAMMHAGTRRDAYGRSSTRSFRQSFLTAYAQRIGERLAQATSQATEQAERDLAGSAAANNLLPVLASREDAVQAKVAEFFPQLVGQSISVTNREGWASGRAAADQARLTAAQAVEAG